MDFDLVLNPDGTVGSLALTRDLQIRAATNRYTQAAAAAASRAIYRVPPYRLPANRTICGVRRSVAISIRVR